MQAGVLLVVYGLIFAVGVPLINATGMFTMPEYRISGLSLLTWTIINACIPALLMFIIGLATGVTILPAANPRYSWWVVSTHVKKISLYVLAVLTIVMCSVTFITTTSWGRDHTVAESGFSPYQYMLIFTTTLVVAIVPTWLGYQCAWTSYVGNCRTPSEPSGTMTQQAQWEDYLQSLETKNVGQWWDRIVVRFYRWATGSDGHKPRGFVAWCIISSIVVATLWGSSIGTYTNNNTIISLIFFFILPTLLLFFVFISKIHDMTTGKRLPRLTPIVGYNNDDSTFDPSSVGTRKFTRL